MGLIAEFKEFVARGNVKVVGPKPVEAGTTL